MILYFTGTGNSGYCAKKISSFTGDTVEYANPLIKKGKKCAFASEEPYVFVAPTYSWQLPRIFTEFIKKSSFGGNRNAYFVMTCGDDIGNAGKYNKTLCDELGFIYKGTAAVKMPENYIAMFDVPPLAESLEIIKASDKTLEEISKTIVGGGNLSAEKTSLSDKLKSGIVNKLFYSLCVKSKAFCADDRCISCGKCERVCPTNTLKLVDGRPVWGEGCTHCMACISYCPAEAIEYGKKSIGKRRYTLQGDIIKSMR